jgi:hypothetical protein
MAACCPAGPARGGGFIACFSGAISPKVNQKRKKMVRKPEKKKQKVPFFPGNGVFSPGLSSEKRVLTPKIRQNV